MRHRDHITPVLCELHCLSIRKHVKFKVACLVHQSPSGQAPPYLAEDCCLVSDSTRHSLQSDDIPTCVVPRTLSSYNDRTFAAAGLACGTLFRSNCAIDFTYGLLNFAYGTFCLQFGQFAYKANFKAQF